MAHCGEAQTSIVNSREKNVPTPSKLASSDLFSFNSKLAVLVSGADVWIKKVRHAHLIPVNLPPPRPVSLSASVWQQPSQPHAFAVCTAGPHPSLAQICTVAYTPQVDVAKHKKSQISEKKHKNNRGGTLRRVCCEINAKNGSRWCVR